MIQARRNVALQKSLKSKKVLPLERKHPEEHGWRKSDIRTGSARQKNEAM